MREADLLQHIYAANARLSSRVTIPPGDDMGAVELGGGTVLLAVDQVGDGVHFHLKETGLARICRKAVTRNLSDVAAMAAKPVSVLAAAMIPRDFDRRRAEALVNAMRTTASDYDCPLMGGDISIWDPPLLISVTIVAETAGIEPVLRHGARPGDGIYVSGVLGNSFDSAHHLDFEPRIDLARRLAGNPETRPHSMIDLSDGLRADLPRLCENAQVELDALPIRPGTPESTWQHALDDGEDYELLFTAPGEGLDSHTQIAGVPIQRIGTVTNAGGLILRFKSGKTIAM